MRCASCNHDNFADALFCDACGAKLESICATCGATNQPDARFCKKCGTRIATESAPAKPAAASTAPNIRVTPEQPDASTVIDGERKTVTALFADIKGSMDLMEDLDPEAARAIVDPVIRLMIEAAHRYDGYVVQSTGDGIFALFGAPVAHEDHPQRALYSALRMQDEVKWYADKLRAEQGVNLQVRVGVNTGEVVVRSITTGDGKTEYTPIGHSTSLASRLQTLANPGSVAISEAVRKLAEGYFLLKPLGPARIKGVSELINVYEVTGLGPLRTRLQRAVGRGLTKFVGREREMEALNHAAAQAKAGRGQIVAAMAEPGVGKSRLLFEFKATSQAGWMVLETFSVSHGKASAYLPVIDLLHGYFKIAGEDDQRARRAKVTGNLLTLDRALEDALPYLFSLLGIVEGDDPLAQMDGQIRKRRTLDAIKRILLRESLNQPLMVIFEDLHWIDEATQELLNLLADSIGTAKFLLLVNYRPEYSHQWNSKTYYTQLRLDPLGKESADEMLSALLGASPAPATQSPGASRERPAGDPQVAGRVRVQDSIEGLKRLIIERTEGTPFFMEEMVQALFEDGVLVRNGTVHLTKPLADLKIPPTVQGILAARIDRLPADAKELLQTLAVLGREFPFALVRSVMRRSDDDLNRMLSDLQLAEFIYEQPAVGDTEYIFKHALTQEVAYNSLLIERRKILHERAGAVIESIFATQLDDHLDQLAHHYSRSDNLAKAIEYLGRAGNQALQRSAYADAIRSLSAAIDLLQRLPESPERDHQELLLQLGVGPALNPVKGWASAETERAFTRAWELCELVGDSAELFPGLVGLWGVYLVRGDLKKSNELAERVFRLARVGDDPALLLYARHLLGASSYCMGEVTRAGKHLEIGISISDPKRQGLLDSRYLGFDIRMGLLSMHAISQFSLGYADQALKRVFEALALAQRLSHPFSLAFAECFVGFVRQYRREVGAAHEVSESLIALSNEQGFAEFSAWANSHRGWAISAQGRNDEGIRQMQEGVAASRAAGAGVFRPYFLTLLAEACMQANRLDDGLIALTESLAIADEHENRQYEAETHRLKGEILLRQNMSNAVEAQRCFLRAIEIARKQSAKSWELRATMSLARLLASQGNRDEARTMLAAIYNWFTEGFDTADLKDAKALLEELQARPVLGEQR